MRDNRIENTEVAVTITIHNNCITTDPSTTAESITASMTSTSVPSPQTKTTVQTTTATTTETLNAKK